MHTAESTYGKLDILVNNAGIAIRGAVRRPVKMNGTASWPLT